MKAILFFILLVLPYTEICSQNSDWSYVNPNPQNDFYAIRFFNQNTGYAIGSGGIFLKNTSGSSSWITIPTNTIKDLFAMHFFDANTGYIAGDGGIILYTTNGGASWTSVTANSAYALRSITFVNQNTGFVAGDHGELYKTTSGITGWLPMNVTSVNLRSVFFSDALTGYVCGDSGKFLKTTNSGLNWTVQTIGTGNLNSVCFINSLTGFLTVRFSNPLKTTDGGITWNSFNIGYSAELNSIKFANANTGYLFGKDGPLSRTTDGGLNWSIWCSYQLFGGNIFYDISHVDSNTAYVCGAKGWILRCYNSAQPFSQHAVHIGGSKSPLSRISFLDVSTGAMMGSSSLMFTTSNAGSNWKITLSGSNSWFEGSSHLTDLWLYTPTSWYRKIYWPGIGGFSTTAIQQSTDGGISWAGNRSFSTYSLGAASMDVFEAGGVSYLTYYSYVMKNSGSNWNTVYSGSLTSSSTGNLYFADANTGFVALNSNGSKAVLYTSNGGTNWTTDSTRSAKWIESVYLKSSGLGFAGCDSSYLLRTANFGTNWTQIPVPNNLRVQNIRFANEYTGWFIGTDHSYPGTGRLFVSVDGGNYFQQMQSLENFNVKGFSFVDALNGYVCGDSGTVLKTTNGGLTFISVSSNTVPKSFGLFQNYPNPFNPTTTIRFDVANDMKRQTPNVKLVIYDVLGREVATLVNEQLQPGTYVVSWDGSNYPSGVYFYKIEVDDFVETKKMILIK